MVFLREGGKDELSLLLERERESNVARSPQNKLPGSATGKEKGKGRALDDDQDPLQESPTRGSKRAAESGDAVSKRKLEHLEPTDTLLHRLAGPSTNKAGLKRDINEVRQVIYNSSKGGNYYKNEERKDEELTIQIKKALVELEEAITRRGGDLSVEEKKADRIIAEEEHKRDLSQYIVVVDCDAFYASVEELDDPSLIGKAFGVGEGVLTTASYEARKFGCRSAMPGYIAKKLCPHLIFVKPDFTKYSAASKKVMDVLARYDPDFAPASLDEAYMNLTPFLKKSGLSAEVAIAQMRAEVKQETGLTVSAGCGANVMLAKIAADVNKPDGQCIIPPTAKAAHAFMQDLSVRKIPGIGRVTEQSLEALGVIKCRDIFANRAKLVLAKGDGGVTLLLRAYLGISNNTVVRGKREDRRGVGHETTFSVIWKPQELDSKLREIADSLGSDLDRLQYSGRTLTLKLKLETYEVSTRAKTLDSGMLFHTADQLYKYGKQLLDTEVMARATAHAGGKFIKGKGKDLRLRLMGLKVSGLRDDSEEAAKKRDGKGSLREWASKSTYMSSAVAGPSRSKQTGPIDLTLLDESDDDEDGFEEIFLEAVPCTICHRTVSLANGVWKEHVDNCSRSKSEPIDLSMSSQGDLDIKPILNPVSKVTDQRPAKKVKSNRDRSISSSAAAGTSKTQKGRDQNGKRGKKKGDKDAFSHMMKQAKKGKS